MRTFHPDEANQAFTTGRLLETGAYAYDPNDHHGPTLYYAAAALQKAGGATGTADLDPSLLRATPALFAVLALVLGACALRKGAGGGKRAAALATILFPILLAATPIFLFFSTFFIQEMLLAALSVGCFASVVFYRASGSPKRGRHLFFLGLCAGLAFATKETALLTFAAALLAAGVVRYLRQSETPVAQLRPKTAVLPIPLLVALLTAVTLFSSFGSHWQGAFDAFVTAPKAYVLHALGWEHTPLAGAHNHPWWWYLKLLLYPDGAPAFSLLPPALGVLAGCLLPSLRRNGAFLFLALHTLILLTAYSLLPYKTPWCMLQVAVPLIAAFAVFTAHGLRSDDRRLRGLAALLALAAFGGFLVADRHLFREPDARDIPYNYAAASPQVVRLAADLEATLGDRAQTYAAVLLPAEDTWPLPFYLRKCSRVGYWHDPEADLRRLAALTEKQRPRVLVVPAELGHLVFPLFPELTRTRRYDMRPGVRVRLFD